MTDINVQKNSVSTSYSSDTPLIKFNHNTHSVETEEEYYGDGKMGYRLSVAKDFVASKISKDLEKIIEIAVKKFEKKGYKEIVNYMHKEEAYLKTNENEIIPFSKEYKLRPF